MSSLIMVMKLDREKDLSDMMNKLDRWDAPIRDYEMKFEKGRHLIKCAKQLCPHWVPKPWLAGRRHLDNYAKVRCMIDEMIRDK